MHKYRLVAKKGEGTFSEVLKAQSIKNGKYVAIKCMKNHFDSLDQVNNLREIQALRRLSPHANIIKLLEVLYDQPTGRLALVFELMDMNIYELIRGRRHYVAEERVKNYMYQLMRAMDHMHRNGIFHRDIKPENILIMDDCLKLADFGSCRGIYSKQPYTEYISTRWYRAPECLLTDGYYNYKMDMWGVGCVFFEIVSLFPLFPGTNELDQIQKIHSILGTPAPELLAKMKKRSAHMDFNFPPKEGTGIVKLVPHVSPECVDLIVKLLAYNPDDRLSARQALRHPYFRDLRDAEKKQKALQAPPEMPLPMASTGHLPHPAGTNAGNGAAHAAAAAQQQQQQQQQQAAARHHQASPVGSEANTLGVTPREHSHAAMERLEAGLPSIAPTKAAAQQQQQQQQQQQPQQPHGAHHGHSHSHVSQLMQQLSSGGANAALEGGAAGTLRGHLDTHAEDALSVESGYGGAAGVLAGGSLGVHRVGGMHGHTNSHTEYAQSEADSTGGLPPIGNLSLGKANMVAGQTQRRGLMPVSGMYGAGHDGSQAGAASSTYVKPSGLKAGSGTSKRQPLAGPKYGASGPSNNSKVASGLVVGQASTLASLKLGAAQAGQDTSGGGSIGGGTYKFKANNATGKGGSKYISPYSLRHLAGAGAGGVTNAGLGAPGS